MLGPTRRFNQFLIAWRYPLFFVGIALAAAAYCPSRNIKFDRSVEEAALNLGATPLQTILVAGAITVISQRLRLPVIFGYLVAGMIVGSRVLPAPLAGSTVFTHGIDLHFLPQCTEGFAVNRHAA